MTFENFQLISEITQIEPTETMSATTTQFAICLREDPQGEDLIRHKIYRVLPDPAAPAGYLRVVDESGEDYLYSAQAFALVSLPPEVAEKLIEQPVAQ